MFLLEIWIMLHGMEVRILKDENLKFKPKFGENRACTISVVCLKLAAAGRG